MIYRMIGTTLVAAVVAFAPLSAAEKDNHGSQSGEMNTQTVCPMTSEDINKKFYSDSDGKRVYFCCKRCKSAFDSDAETAETMLKKLEAEGVKLEKVALKQSLCPVMGGEINADLYSDADGKRVYFCCAMCKPTFEKDPAKYIHEMEARGIELEKAPKGE